ncbi:MAG: hypothetical protein LBJ81_02330 [Puniceicoccales bacterium]|nr:hypothetical protein [Puniceicoccales bacterium]
MVLSILLSLLLAVALLSFNWWFPGAAEWYVEHKSGFKLRIGQSNCAIYRGLIDFNGVEIQNPEGKFSQEGCLKFDHLMAKANLLTAMSPEIVVDEVILSMERAICEKNSAGETNLLVLQNAFSMLKNGDSSDAPKRRHGTRKKNRGDGEKTVAVADGASSGGPLKFFAQGGGRLVIRKMTIHVGSFELHNVTTSDEQRVIDVNQTWTLTDVRSRKEVIDFVTARLQNYGVGIVIQNVFGAIFNLPGVRSVKSAMEKVSHLGRGMLKSVSEAMTQALPKGETAAPADEFSKNADAEGSDSRSAEDKKDVNNSHETSDSKPLIEQVRSAVKFDASDGD